MKARREHHIKNTHEKQTRLKTHPPLERQTPSYLSSFLHSEVLFRQICVKHTNTRACANTTHLQSTSASCTQGGKDGQLANEVRHSATKCSTDGDNVPPKGSIIQPEPCCHRPLWPDGTRRICNFTSFSSLSLSLSCSTGIPGSGLGPGPHCPHKTI